MSIGSEAKQPEEHPFPNNGWNLSYAFGGFRFVPRQGLLIHNGKPVKIGIRALDLLQLLVERQGDLVSKEELIRFAWPSVFVDESNLKVNIASVRRALQLDGNAAPYIVTVPRRGYRFAAPVRLEKAADKFVKPPSAFCPGVGLPELPDPVGRADDIAALTSAVSRAGIVTIVGPAGVGKTTIAVECARVLSKSNAQEATFVDLTAVGDPLLVPAAIAVALGIRGTADPLMEVVIALSKRDHLIILDNCEHVLAAASSAAAQIHHAVPRTRIIATSREPLVHAAGHIFRLQPLACPPAHDQPLDKTLAMNFAAFALFVARANQIAEYQITDSETPIVAEICRRLDGLPLAIELAAPRLRSYSVDALLKQLTNSIEVLNCGPRNGPLRHQALQTTLDWSYRLLSDAEAKLFRLLSVFPGTFYAEDICGICAEHNIISPDILGIIANLAMKSLVSQSSETYPVFRLLESTRSYASERLVTEGEQRAACESHARYIQHVFDAASLSWGHLSQQEWMATYRRYVHDLRKAIDWAFSDGGCIRLGVTLTVAAIPLWDYESSVGESSYRVNAALAAAKISNNIDTNDKMKLAAACARNAAFAERLSPDAELVCSESLKLAELNGNIDYQLRSLWALAVVQSFSGRNRDAATTLDKLDAVALRVQDHWAKPASARFRIMTDFYCGDVVRAHAALDALAQRYSTPDNGPQASRFQIDPYVTTRTSLAFVSCIRGESAQAINIATQALNCAQFSGNIVAESNVLALAAIPISLWTGQLVDAESYVSRFNVTLDKKGVTSWRPLSSFFEAFIDFHNGGIEAVERMKTAIDAILSNGFLLRTPVYLSMLAEAAVAVDRTDLACATINAAEDYADRHSEVWCRPELLRVQALLCVKLGQHSKAEQTLKKAINLANSLGAILFQLRASHDLARLWSFNKPVKSDIRLIDPVYRRFAAHVANGDIDQAKKLLDQDCHDECRTT